MAEKAIELYNKIDTDERFTHNVFSYNGNTLKYLKRFVVRENKL